MIQNEKLRIGVNRVLSFVLGGLLVYVVVSMTIVSNIKGQKEQLAKELDESRYEAGRLLADAKAQLAQKDYGKAKGTLTALLEKRPGSNEATEGKRIYAEVEATIANENARWEAAVAGIRAQWAKEMTAKLRGQSEEQRLQMEKDMDNALNKEWEKMKDQIRQEWAKQK